MSTDGGRFPFYTVRRGRVPGVYRSWQECEQQVNGYRNSEHRGFHDLAEAVAWLRSTAAFPARQSTPPVQTVRRKPSKLLEGAFCSMSSPQLVSSGIVPSNSQECGGGSNPVEQGVVEPASERAFMHVEDMELMLLRACSFFQIGLPIFVPREINLKDDNVLFGLTVVLPHNGRGLDLVAHGSLCYSEHFACQEVSFTMLDKILSTTGYTIRDYNHRIVVRVTAQLNQEKKEKLTD